MSIAAQGARLNIESQFATRTPTASVGSHSDAQNGFACQGVWIRRFCGRFLFQLKPSQTASNLRKEVLQLLHGFPLILRDVVVAVVRRLAHSHNGMKEAHAMQRQCDFRLDLWKELFSIAVLPPS